MKSPAKVVVVVVVVMILMLLTAGCAHQGYMQKQTSQKSEDLSVLVDMALAERAREAALSVPGVKESTAVALNQEVTVGVKVTGFDRLRLKAIKNEVHNKIKAMADDHNVHVTSDKKHYVQLKQIEDQLSQPAGQDYPGIFKRVDKIIGEIDS